MVNLQTVIEELNTGKIEFDYKDDDCCTTEGEVVILLKRLAELETADVVEVKHGEWKNPSIKRFEGRYLVCSECDVILPIITELLTFDFCPRCGAKMDGRSDKQ